MIPVNDLRAGTVFKDNGRPYSVIKYSHLKMGRGNAVVKIKARNIRTASVIEKSFLSGSSVEEADVEKIKVQYLYRAGSNFIFMDLKTFDNIELREEFLGDNIYYLKEGGDCEIMKFEGSPVSILLPTTVVLEISETGSGFKGNTVSSVGKAALLETGLKCEVPLFIRTGDRVKIDTRDGSYVNRV